IPAALLGAWLGLRIFKRFSDRQFELAVKRAAHRVRRRTHRLKVPNCGFAIPNSPARHYKRRNAHVQGSEPGVPPAVALDTLRAGPAGDRSRDFARLRSAQACRRDEASGRRVHQADQDGDRPRHLFHCRVGYRGMQSMKKVGRVGGKALIYFEVVSTLALVIGMLVGNWLTPGAGFNADPAKLDATAVGQYAGKAHEQSVIEYLLNIIPNTIVDAFAKGDILPIVLVSIAIGYALARLGEKGRPIRGLIDAGNNLLFAAINVVMRFAPLGAFGAMAFTIGRYGIGALGPLVTLIGVFYVTSAIFVLGVLGAIAAIAGFNILKLLSFIKDEILIVLGTASSDTVLPSLMEKLERAGCSKPVVGLVVPTGYVFNTDGSSIYITLAALFVAQATSTDLTLQQQLAIFLVAVLTSKGASGVAGSGFIALVATLSVVPTIPLAGMALILGIDRFMAEARSLVNMIGNA